MTRFSVFLTGAALVLAACTPAEQARLATLSMTPVLDGGTYSTGGGITVAAELREIEGMTGLCGAWAESEKQSVLSKGYAGRVMGTGSAYVNGKILHRGLGFMRKSPASASYGGLESNCVVTDRPWQPGDESAALNIRIPRQVVHREINDGDGTSISVIFRQTGPGASAPVDRLFQ